LRKHIIRGIESPKPEKREIQPYAEEDVKTMMNSLGKSKTYTRPGKVLLDHSLRTADRNRAILLLMVDTGLRASELCNLRVLNVDQKHNRIFIQKRKVTNIYVV